MGFKRTAEGRVFFQNIEEKTEAQPGNGANGRGMDDGKPKMRPAGAAAKGPVLQAPLKPGRVDPTQLQILTLLKSLNERLKDTQTEREEMRRELDTYRGLIESVRSRTEQNEEQYSTLEQKIAGAAAAPDGGRAQRAEEIAADTMKELEETRRLMLEIEERAEDAIRHVAALKSEIGTHKSTAADILKKQAALEKAQQEHVQKIEGSAAAYARLTRRLASTEEKHDQLSSRLDETAGQHERLVRKIEKAVQERSRLLRKMDRIEETVIQTRDALNARALVLLTDQDNAKGGPVLDVDLEEGLRSAERSLQRKIEEESDFDALPAWRKPLHIPAVATGVLLVVFLLAGWLASQLFRAELPDLSGLFRFERIATTEPVSGQQTPPAKGKPVTPARTPVEREPLDAPRSEAAEPAASAAAGPEDPFAPVWNGETPVTATVQTPEILALTEDESVVPIDLEDEEALVRMLEDKPQELAAQLNGIEPGTVPGEQAESVIMAAAPATASAEPVEPAPAAVTAAPKPQPPAETPDLPRMNFSSSTPDELAARIKPDSALPAMIREVETQAFNGVPEAQHDLAAIYVAGHGGVTRNYERAALWFEEAAKGGIANARYNLGVLYHQGLGVRQDMKEAISWYAAAADLKHPEAQYNLGIAYIEGIGVPYDPIKAARYFESAAAGGVMEAAYNLGLIYENGLLGEAQPDEALMWYKTAADAGSPEAKAALEQLARSLNISIEEVNRLAESMKMQKQSSNRATGPAVKIVKESTYHPEAGEAADRQAKTETAAAPDAPQALQPGDRAGITALYAGDEADRNSAATLYDWSTGQAGDNNEAESRAATTAQIQEYLMRSGLYPGPADGHGGPLTRDAIRSYQTLNSLPADGEPSRALLAHMLSRFSGGPLEVGSRE